MDREVLASCLALEVWDKGYVKPTSHQSTSSAHMKCWLPWSDRSLRLEIFRRVPNGMKVVWRKVMNRFMALAICLATATDPRTTGDVNQAQFGWNRLCIGLTTLWADNVGRVVFPQMETVVQGACIAAIWGGEQYLNLCKALVLCVDPCVQCPYGAMRSRKSYKICRSFWKDLSVQRACLYLFVWNSYIRGIHTCTHR